MPAARRSRGTKYYQRPSRCELEPSELLGLWVIRAPARAPAVSSACKRDTLTYVLLHPPLPLQAFVDAFFEALPAQQVEQQQQQQAQQLLRQFEQAQASVLQIARAFRQGWLALNDVLLEAGAEAGFYGSTTAALLTESDEAMAIWAWLRGDPMAPLDLVLTPRERAELNPEVIGGPRRSGTTSRVITMSTARCKP